MIIVGIGEYAITKNPDEAIITHALGSCVAFIVHCEKTKVTSLAHIVLPESRRTVERDLGDKKPAYCANIFVPRLLEFYLKENRSLPHNLKISLVGGSNSRNENDVFRVGARNVEKINEILARFRLKPVKVDVGGNISRTVSVDVNDGNINIRSRDMIL